MSSARAFGGQPIKHAYEHLLDSICGVPVVAKIAAVWIRYSPCSSTAGTVLIKQENATVGLNRSNAWNMTGSHREYDRITRDSCGEQRSAAMARQINASLDSDKNCSVIGRRTEWGTRSGAGKRHIEPALPGHAARQGLGEWTPAGIACANKHNIHAVMPSVRELAMPLAARYARWRPAG